ncbi:NAD-dependent DNA ligase OB-fold domain-containing protein [Cyclospora cayetanensis]|uniref:DNA ligase (NAD(+)) n=1 Tax=Cyclospora cayetanensis TaxID=88456 RepID=A0A1D3D749_9EIME|nr:NAD-dependent DNA ligase OB-fold domain-containing protein [Cyclospora cayetanensis]
MSMAQEYPKEGPVEFVEAKHCSRCLLGGPAEKFCRQPHDAGERQRCSLTFNVFRRKNATWGRVSRHWTLACCEHRQETDELPLLSDIVQASSRRPVLAAASLDSSVPDVDSSATAETTVKAFHAQLCNKIEELNKAYFGGEDPLATDEAYDALWMQLQVLEKEGCQPAIAAFFPGVPPFSLQKHPHLRLPDSPLRRVGAVPVGVGAHAGAPAANCQHLAPVLSLESVHAPAEASRLFDRLDRRRCEAAVESEASSVKVSRALGGGGLAELFDGGTLPASAAAGVGSRATGGAAEDGGVFAAPLLLEPKVDGQSLSLTYMRMYSSSATKACKNAVRYRLVRALTRGDGLSGEDVTNKALVLGSVGVFPLEIAVGGASTAVDAGGRAGDGGSLAPEKVAAGEGRQAGSGFASGDATRYPRQIEVRGEAFMGLDAFASLNKDRRERSLKAFSSPRCVPAGGPACSGGGGKVDTSWQKTRNRGKRGRAYRVHAVVGLLRRVDNSSDVEDSSIRFCAYGLVAEPSAELPLDPNSGKDTHSSAFRSAAAAGAAVAGVSTQQELLRRLQQWGFEVLLPHSLLVASRREALAAFEEQSHAHAAYQSRLEEVLRGPPSSNAAADGGEAGAETGGAAAAAPPIPAVGFPLPLESVPCDGVVFKLNSLQHQWQLSSTARAPRWAFALKFAAVATRTRVVAVEWTVGSSGVCTPVAVLQPVLLGGVTLGRASLHSLQEMRRKDVRLGDLVYVQLKGESVPQICRVDSQARSSESKPVCAPTHCPSCERVLMERSPPAMKTPEASAPLHPSRRRTSKQGNNATGEAAATPPPAGFTTTQDADRPKGVLWCSGGWACGAQRLQRLRRFFSRDGLAVAGLGPRALEALTAKGYLKARDALFKEIQQVQERGVQLQRLLFALGIPGMGRRAASALARKAQTFDGFLRLLEGLAASSKAPQSVVARDPGIEPESETTPQIQMQTQIEEKLPGIDSVLFEELKLFGSDARNRQQLLEIAKMLPVHPMPASG